MANGSGNAVAMAPLDHCIVAPDGRKVRVDAKVFEAFWDFIQNRKQGSVTVNFITGGVRGVRSETVYL